MELIHCASAKKIKLNDSNEVIIGRRSDSVRAKNLSRSQVSLKGDSSNKSIVITNLGNNLIIVKGNSVLKQEKVTVFGNFDLELPGKIKYKVRGCGDTTNHKMNRPQVMDNLTIEMERRKELDIGWNELDNGKIIVFTRMDLTFDKEPCKVVAFDMDGTLIKTRSGKVFPVDENDWVFYTDGVVSKLRKLNDDGYKIVIFSNQAGIALGSTSKRKIKMKIEAIARQLGVPLQVYLATGYDFYRKPCPGMWFSYLLINDISVDNDNSTFVGDAAGRPQNWCKGKKKDHSNVDLLFARNINLKFLTPEEYFLDQPQAPFNEPIFDPKSLPLKNHADYNLAPEKTEVILMVGSPGSGKSHFVVNRLLPEGYVSVSRDILNTWQNCIKAMEKYLELDKNVVIDNTNPNQPSREKFIQVAKRYKATIRCFIMESSKELCKHNNKFRQLTDKNHTLVTDVIINDFWKKYEEPTYDEGIDEIVKVPFVPSFSDTKDQELYNMYLN